MSWLQIALYSFVIYHFKKVIGSEFNHLGENCAHWPWRDSLYPRRLHQFIEPTYVRTRPPTWNITLKFSLALYHDYSLDEHNERLRIGAYGMLQWTDKRLSLLHSIPYNVSKCLPENLTSYCLSNTDGVYKLEYSSFKTNAWMPSFMVGKMVDSSQGGSTAEDVLTYMSLCDGFVTLLQKPRYAISCPLELGWFPFDTQFCELTFFWEAVDFERGAAWLDWRTPPIVMKSILREVDTNWHKSIYYYSRLPGCEDCDTRVLTVIVKMERKATSYAIQTILPSMMMVVISFSSLSIPPEQVPGRMGLCITTALTLVSMSNGLFSTAPRTSYLKAIDIWLLACFTFSFVVLIEYCTVISLIDKERKNKVDKKTSTTSKYRVNLTASGIERRSRVLLPLAFALFCCLYFAAVYCNSAPLPEFEGHKYERVREVTNDFLHYSDHTY